METITIVLAVLTPLCTIASFFLARNAEAKKHGREDGELKSDIGYIKRRVDDIILEQRETNKTLDAYGERITRVEESAKQAHKRIDGIENKISRKNTAKE
ncbi:MAG: hypothetical protein LBP79_01330 [Clostridiales bacterium]|jgi:septal ring factor EnvC (AmiA/AmiB activator)|nr:hypothetical protein [Clostridiales bacterium]